MAFLQKGEGRAGSLSEQFFYLRLKSRDYFLPSRKKEFFKVLIFTGEH